MERLRPPLLGLILAGGNSSRMGQDKALLPWNGVPLLAHVYQCAATVCSSVYVITPRIATYAPLLPQGCQFIPEQGVSQGPVSAFQEAIVFLDLEASTWILLLSCDLPNLTAAALQDWFQSLCLDNLFPSEPPLAYVPRNPEGWWEPLCGFYQVGQCRSSLDRFLTQGGRSFQHWLDQESVVALPLADPNILLNLNN